MQKAMGKNQEGKEEEAKFAEASIEEIRRPFQFYPISRRIHRKPRGTVRSIS